MNISGGFASLLFTLVLKGGTGYFFDEVGRISAPDLACGDILGDHSTGGDNGIVTDGDIADDESTGTYPDVVSDDRLSVLLKSDGNLLVDPTVFPYGLCRNDGGKAVLNIQAAADGSASNDQRVHGPDQPLFESAGIPDPKVKDIPEGFRIQHQIPKQLVLR